MIEVERFGFFVIEQLAVWTFNSEDNSGITHIQIFHSELAMLLMFQLFKLSDFNLHLDAVLLVPLPPSRLDDETSLVQPEPEEAN